MPRLFCDPLVANRTIIQAFNISKLLNEPWWFSQYQALLYVLIYMRFTNSFTLKQKKKKLKENQKQLIKPMKKQKKEN